MQIRDFPFCCTATILCDFGESQVSEGIRREIPRRRLLNEGITYVINSARENAVVTAVTNSEQKTAIKVLKELKFQSTRWLSKSMHPETKIKLWWLPIEDAKRLFSEWLELPDVSTTTKLAINRAIAYFEKESVYAYKRS